MKDQPKTVSDLWAAYPELCRRLSVFFRFNRNPDPEDLAEETLFRVLKHIEGGSNITNLAAYVYGVARNVLFEQRKKQAKELESHELYRVSPSPPGWSPEKETRLEALGRALRELPARDREIVRTYYAYAGEKKINSRRELAQKLGITESSLKIRLYRIRHRLREEVERQLQKIEMEERK